jgi:hypothetical protein
LYAFGELVEKTCSIEEVVREKGVQIGEVDKNVVDTAKKEKLEKLLAQGLISQEEFEKAMSN